MTVYDDILKEDFKFRRDTRTDFGITTLWMQDSYFGFEAGVTGIPMNNIPIEASEARRLLDDMRTARKRFCDMVAPEVTRLEKGGTATFWVIRDQKPALQLGPKGVAAIVKSMTSAQWAKVREESQDRDPYVDRLIAQMEGLA